MTSTQWVLRRATLDALLQLMAGSGAQAASERAAPAGLRAAAPPAGCCLLHVFVTARRQWSVIEREPGGVRGEVLRRDDYRCAVPVCSERRSLEVHHIRFRSAGGDDHPQNLVTLCAFHHHALHDGRLRIRGRVFESAEDLSYELAIDTTGQARARFHGEEVRP
ncbi:MAG TPA: HNH endonuclease [Chromatiales bacterium]|nr:HNH endonuclease [Chromatiales bacterium]